MQGLAADLIKIKRAVAEQPAPGSPEAEAASNALLAEHHAWRDGAHSERPDTKWNTKHSSHKASDPRPALEKLDTYIETQDIIAAAAVGLDPRKYMVWHFMDQEGVTRKAVATTLNCSERTVTRILAGAREDLKYLVSGHVRTVFRREIRDKHPCQAPPARPPLTLDVELARERIEMMPELTTHIMPDDQTLVEVWVNGQRPLDIHGKPVGGRRIHTLKERIKVKVLFRKRLIASKVKRKAKKLDSKSPD